MYPVFEYIFHLLREQSSRFDPEWHGKADFKLREKLAESRLRNKAIPDGHYLNLTGYGNCRNGRPEDAGIMSKRHSGFSLIELLMVLGVMAILMGMLVPSVGIVREKAQRMATGQKLRQIGLAVATYQSVTGQSLKGSDLGDWMARLASETGVREGKLYIFEEDPLLAAAADSIPPVLVKPGKGGDWEEVEGFEDWPIGVAVVSGLNLMSNPSTTPVAWTRGLASSGKWQDYSGQRPGIYGSKGGFIVFLDGHVEYHTDLARGGGQLVDFSDGSRTADIRQAIGPGTTVFDFLGRVF